MAVLLGRYELQRLLGRGGMAEVYLARRRAGGVEKRLVIKRIRRERAGDPRFLDMFVNEARLSMSLSHQNVVTVFDFGRLGDDVFLAMEHVEGRDLASTLARAAAPISPLLAAHIASECCRGLAHAHRRIGSDGVPLHVVHRDVTPRNVLLSWAGEVKLTDFGVAALAGAADERVRGTWAYMAPEQARGEVVDPRADLYALGLMLWEMVAGRRARRGVDAAALADEARTGALPPLPPGPPALVDIIARATSADPARRPADADAMLAALDAYVVAERAATPGPAPGRQLADFLAEVWGEQVGELAGDAGGPVTMLSGDDGGEATLRSMAETAGEVGGVEDAAPPAAQDVRDAQEVREPRRRLRLAMVSALAAGVVSAIVAAIVMGGGSPRTAAETHDAPASSADAPGAPAIPADAPGSPPTPATDARASERPIPTGVPRRPSADAADAAEPAPAPVLRDVTIGAEPWADFTVDDDPTVHQTPETVRLPPGRHRVTFRNPQLAIERTVTIDVPADRDHRHVERMVAP